MAPRTTLASTVEDMVDDQHPVKAFEVRPRPKLPAQATQPAECPWASEGSKPMGTQRSGTADAAHRDARPAGRVQDAAAVDDGADAGEVGGCEL